ncbi:hypothetical protein PYCCODRAFT_170159 [Trametes coccinea BRFM310]|uniref:Uncharacterized protein n=1 Tax=Trametes coccinea (strain BRFM310) TaxID=1353009 RepID=A0A1Y2ISA2_TRAC3|nr:hypothetical protein PYCCODRAFT_170159 [Trametes coccinea BRFM310]
MHGPHLSISKLSRVATESKFRASPVLVQLCWDLPFQPIQQQTVPASVWLICHRNTASANSLSDAPDLMSWPAIGGSESTRLPRPRQRHAGAFLSMSSRHLSYPLPEGAHDPRFDSQNRAGAGDGHAFFCFLEAWRMISTNVEGRHRPLHEPTEARYVIAGFCRTERLDTDHRPSAQHWLHPAEPSQELTRIRRAERPVPYSSSVSSSPKCGGGSGTCLASVREDVTNEGAIHDARRATHTAPPSTSLAETETARLLAHAQHGGTLSCGRGA